MPILQNKVSDLMIRLLTLDQLDTYLQELLKWNAVEFREEWDEVQKRHEVKIPYVMNDCVECFFRLTNTNVLGEWNEMMEGQEIRYSLEQNQNRYGLLLQREQNRISIWFDSAVLETRCYQYHRIGHKWRKQEGEEEIRRLVNLLCVLHDKKEYLGESACNRMEAELAFLAEFHPLMYWTPINESILNWYPESDDGIEAMLKLAEEAGDIEYKNLISSYKKLWPGSKKQQKQVQVLALKLMNQNHKTIIHILRCKIEQASLCWEERRYGAEQQKEIEFLRRNADRKYRDMGYDGAYPLYSKMNIDSSVQENLYLAEEQPFVELESNDYHFSIIPIYWKE